ncbi:MAG: stage II sporulation protein M [Frankiaceae bacterium]
MDLDAYVAVHRGEWDRLAELTRRARRPRRLKGPEADELIELYQRTATHLSVIQSRAPDPSLVSRLSSLVARARSAIGGSSAPAWQDVARFLWVVFPAAAWRLRRWWLGATAASLIVAAAMAVWIVTSPSVQTELLPPADVRQLVLRDFVNYYSENPAGSFAARVWTNNAWVSAGCLSLGVLLGLPTLYILLQNALNVGVAAGFLISAGKANVFFGLILPHGLLELTAVFLAAAAGLKLGWTVIDPGRRRRVDALAEEGRAAMSIAVGLVLVLFVSGVIEAFVTPSPLPTWARIGIGVLAEGTFLAYVVLLGRRAAAVGEIGDVRPEDQPALAPIAG